MTGRDLTMVQTITPEERQLIMDTARSLTEYVPPPKPPRRSTSHPSAPRDRSQSFARSHSRRPGDVFNERAKWADILEPHGWKYLGDGCEGLEYWAHPGKTNGNSATVNHQGNDLFHVFSSSADPFEMDRSYTKFAAYTLLNHNGDFAQAARALRAEGYEGDSYVAGPMPSLAEEYSLFRISKEKQ
jgi:hypothetical protein